MDQNDAFDTTLKLKKMFAGAWFQEEAVIMSGFTPWGGYTDGWEFELLAVPVPQPPARCNRNCSASLSQFLLLFLHFKNLA